MRGEAPWTADAAPQVLRKLGDDGLAGPPPSSAVAREDCPSKASCCGRGERTCAIARRCLSLAISSAKAGEPRAMCIDSCALGCWPAGGMGNRLLGPKRGESSSATWRGELRGESGDGVQPFSTPAVGPAGPKKADFLDPANAKLSSPRTLTRALPAIGTPRAQLSVDARGSAQSTPPRGVGIFILYCALRSSSWIAI
eukprot:scaffold21979_cov66-Phaeocystis_antarctica.AAC.9